MHLVLPPFELSPGTITCLHIPHGFRETGRAIDPQLFQLAARLGKEIFIARPAGFEAGTGGAVGYRDQCRLALTCRGNLRAGGLANHRRIGSESGGKSGIQCGNSKGCPWDFRCIAQAARGLGVFYGRT